ncbi:hypothetical protein ACTFIZ_008357 [Dictyostelium cf. discoideum]
MKLVSLNFGLLLLLLLTIIITKTNAIKFNKESPIYVNFIPFKNGFNCQSKVNGLGYSMAIDTCISFDGYVTSWEFSWNQNTGSIIGTKYNGVCKPTNHNSTSPPYKFTNMGCDKGGDLILNPTRLPTQIYDYKIQISTTPIYPANSLYLVTQRLDSCAGTVVAYEFLTNETIAIAPGKIAYTYYCMPNGLPEMVDDSNGIVLKGDSCDMFRPFINGSSESSYSGTSGENLIVKSKGKGKGKGKGNIYNNKNGGGFGNAPFINFNDLILFGSGSGDTASGVTTAQPTTANPTSADSTSADSTGTYTGDSPKDGGGLTGTSTGDNDDGGTSTGTSTSTSTGDNDDGGTSTGYNPIDDGTTDYSTGGDTGANTSNESTGGTTQPSTGGNNSGGASSTSGSSETHVIFLTNTCSSA